MDRERMSMGGSRKLLDECVRIYYARKFQIPKTQRFLVGMRVQLDEKKLGFTAKQVIVCRKIIKETLSRFNKNRKKV
jgi:hypothetical protein